MTVAAAITVHSTPSLPSQVIALTTPTAVALPAIRRLMSAAALWSADSSGAHCRRTAMSKMVKTIAATVTVTSGARLRSRRRPEGSVFMGALLRRNADRDRAGTGLDPQLGQAAAEALARVRHHGDVRHAGPSFPGRSAHTFRQRAS